MDYTKYDFDYTIKSGKNVQFVKVLYFSKVARSTVLIFRRGLKSEKKIKKALQVFIYF